MEKIENAKIERYIQFILAQRMKIWEKYYKATEDGVEVDFFPYENEQEVYNLWKKNRKIPGLEIHV